MVYQLLYGSVAAHRYPHISDVDILELSWVLNAAHGITGFLMRGPEHFLQVLEGDQKAVDMTMDRILADERHRDARVLATREVADRDYGEWSMGFAELAEDFDDLMAQLADGAQLDPDRAAVVFARIKDLATQKGDPKGRPLVAE